ncbi:MAG: alpha/beta hydrolase [Chloroflexota bacterium]
MGNQEQPKRAPTSQSRGRRFLIWLGGLVAVLLGLMLLGALYESVAEAADAKAYPPPGQLVDVGGHRLHITCTGTGSPTVVIDAGLGAWSTSWGSVQRDVAETTRVCTYDRAGSGWSEEGPLPRNAGQFAKELHALLQGASIPGPYVLVGHSAGGFTVLVFAGDYPSEVAGVVLIDSMGPGQFKPSAADANTEAASQGHALPLVSGLARLGVMRMVANLPGIVPSEMPDKNAYLAMFARPQYWQAHMDDAQGMTAGAAQAAAVKTFGALPLIVLSRGLDQQPDWLATQADLVQMSSHSEQLFADKSGHNIQVDQPEAAVGAIVRMVEQTRR